MKSYVCFKKITTTSTKTQKYNKRKKLNEKKEDNYDVKPWHFPNFIFHLFIYKKNMNIFVGSKLQVTQEINFVNGILMSFCVKINFTVFWGAFSWGFIKSVKLKKNVSEGREEAILREIVYKRSVWKSKKSSPNYLFKLALISCIF